MKKIYLLLILMTFAFSAQAHDPLSSKFSLKETASGAILEISLTQTGVHSALTKTFPNTDFESIPTDDYKQLLISYLKDRIHLKADGQLLVIGSGAIKLGSHQTDLKFFVEQYPKASQNLEISVKAFAENGRQHTVFWWYTPSLSQRVMLTHQNDFSEKLSLIQEPNEASIFNDIGNNGFWIMIVLIVMPLMTYLSKKVSLHKEPE